MPPGPAYNWLCVLYSTAEILSHAARHRAAQVVPRSTSAPLTSRKRRRTGETAESAPILVVDHTRAVERSFEHEFGSVNGGKIEEPGPNEADALTKEVQPIGQDTGIPPLAAKSSGNAASTVQVQSQNAAAAEVIYPSSIIQNVDTQTVRINSAFNRTFL